ncbi:MAG: hypothetical protein HY898_02215 [Deltaproteobacteria bacterium]|nr:hypothetical protein [Deltaproteobacteria bacterium]
MEASGARTAASMAVAAVESPLASASNASRIAMVRASPWPGASVVQPGFGVPCPGFVCGSGFASSPGFAPLSAFASARVDS